MLSIHAYDKDHVQDPKFLYAIRTRKETLTGQLVIILFSKTGTMNRAFEEIGYSNVWSIDIQNPDCNEFNHVLGDWKIGLQQLEKKFGEAQIIVAFPDCQYLCFNGNAANARKAGVLTEKEDTRCKKKVEAAKIMLDVLNLERPVVMAENGKGYLMRALFRIDGKQVYNIVQPWNFFDPSKPDPNDNHVKETHLFSGGDRDALDAYPITNFFKTYSEPSDVQKNWVNLQKSYNDRSKTPQGMANAIAHCCRSRLQFFESSLSMTRNREKRINQVKFILKESELNPPPLGKKCCNRLENDMVCNLPLGHNGDDRNMKNGTNLRCGVFDYERDQYLYEQPLLSSQRQRMQTSMSEYELLANHTSNEGKKEIRVNKKRKKNTDVIEIDQEAKYYMKNGGNQKYNYIQLMWRRNNDDKFKSLGYHITKEAAVDRIKQHCTSFGYSFPPKHLMKELNGRCRKNSQWKDVLQYMRNISENNGENTQEFPIAQNVADTQMTQNSDARYIHNSKQRYVNVDQTPKLDIDSGFRWWRAIRKQLKRSKSCGIRRKNLRNAVLDAYMRHLSKQKTKAAECTRKWCETHPVQLRRHFRKQLRLARTKGRLHTSGKMVHIVLTNTQNLPNTQMTQKRLVHESGNSGEISIKHAKPIYYMKIRKNQKKETKFQLLWRLNNEKKNKSLGLHTSKEAVIDKIREHCFSSGYSYPPDHLIKEMNGDGRKDSQWKDVLKYIGNVEELQTHINNKPSEPAPMNSIWNELPIAQVTQIIQNLPIVQATPIVQVASTSRIDYSNNIRIEELD